MVFHYKKEKGLKMRFIIFTLVFFNIYISNAISQDTIIPVGEAELAKTKLYLEIEKATLPNQVNLMNSILEIVGNDFSFYRSSFEIFKKVTGKDLGAQDVGVSFSIDADNQVSAQVTLRSEKKNVKFTHDKNEEVREFAHRISDSLYQMITGKKSIFLSRIIFVSNLGTTNQNEPIKELHIMDFDGKNAKKLTNHRGTVISPAFSFSGKKIIYSLIVGKGKNRNINLHEYSLDSGKSTLVSSLPGINSGAIYLPGDNRIALTLSHSGNAEIYIMDLATKKLDKITDHYAPDVDPDLTLDGTLMTFLSGRPGKAMIYTMDPRLKESSVKRIGYVGEFNATPRFSPDGKLIAFSSWVDNRFDIFRINSDGTGLYRLTKDFGSNEDPSFSIDGEFILFSSQRVLSLTKAVQNIYIMDKDGEIIGALTENYGNCITPRWSKY